jgi:hypothetical protein
MESSEKFHQVHNVMSDLCLLNLTEPFTATASESLSGNFGPSIAVEYEQLGNGQVKVSKLPLVTTEITFSTKISTYMNDTYRVVIHEILRPAFTEINGELIHLKPGNSCATLRVIFPLDAKTWKWYRGLDKTEMMKAGMLYTDTVGIRTVLPPDGAFNSESLREGGYGDPVGKGSMSYYPLAAITSIRKGTESVLICLFLLFTGWPEKKTWALLLNLTLLQVLLPLNSLTELSSGLSDLILNLSGE